MPSYCINSTLTAGQMDDAGVTVTLPTSKQQYEVDTPTSVGISWTSVGCEASAVNIVVASTLKTAVSHGSITLNVYVRMSSGAKSELARTGIVITMSYVPKTSVSVD